MQELFKMLEGAGVWGWVALGVFLLIMVLIGMRMFGKRTDKDTSQQPRTEKKSRTEIITDNNTDDTDIEELDSPKIGADYPYRCLCFRKIKGVAIADFTSISEPLGELYIFDPSCPTPGSGYIVKQNEDGTITDYDPREVKVETDQTPDHAWHAINWKEDVTAFWTVPVNWWKNTANWYAAGVLGLVFMGILVVLG